MTIIPANPPHLLCLPSSFTDLIRCLFLFFSSPPPQLGLGPAGFHLLRYVHPSVDSGAIGVCLRLRRDGAPNLQARLQLPHLRHVLQGPAARRELSPPPMHIFSLEVVTFFAHSSRSSRSNKKNLIFHRKQLNFNSSFCTSTIGLTLSNQQEARLSLTLVAFFPRKMHNPQNRNSLLATFFHTYVQW